MFYLESNGSLAFEADSIYISMLFGCLKMAFRCTKFIYESDCECVNLLLTDCWH